MDTSSDKTAGSERGASIRLRYSRQFQSGGHAHTIDAETILPVGANQEKREQVLHEMEIDVEQLARQIIQRATRPAGEPRQQVPARPGPNSPAARTTEPTRFQSEATTSAAQHQATNTSLPISQTPVSENMPASPASSGEGNTVRLPQFINAIKKRWDMSLKEAMDLLHVTTLEGANLREVYAQLQAIMESRNANTPRANTQGRITQSMPVVEAPRQVNRSTQPQQPPAPRSSVNQATTAAPETRSQGQAALKDVARPAPPTIPIQTSDHADKQPREREQDFAGSPKAPIPIQIGMVRDIPPHPYTFEEEEGDEAFELPEDENAEDDADRRNARIKLDELKGIRGTSVASAGRMTVLNNVVDSQISEEQLLKIIQAAWDINTKKKLKADQIEALISWAKEDSFVEMAEAMLALIEEGEE